MLVVMAFSSMNTRRVVSSQPCSRIQRRRARATLARLRSAARRLFLKVMPWRAKKRESALRLPGIRRLCSTETIPFNVRFRCPRTRARICCEYFSKGEVLPPRGIGSQTPSSRKRCIQRIAELALTWNGSAASRRDPPVSTSELPVFSAHPGMVRALPSPPPNQCVRLAPSEPLGNPDSLRSGRAVARMLCPR